MGAFFNNGEQYGGTATTASQVMYNTTESVADKINELDGKTGEDIPVNTLTPNTSINSAINACFGRTGSDIPVSDSDSTSVADKLDNVPTFDTLTSSDNNKLLGVSVSGSEISVGAVAPSSLFTSHSTVLSFSNTKTVFVDVNIDISKIIIQGAVLSADAAVPLICSIQSLGSNSTRIRVNALQNYTSYLTLYYLAIN